ncbi:Lrp/AsnC family transcriptional regulator [Halorussus salilacus]|uniref:Lrp/AsnC family transcriptional regulator n=1 Tax=Halorussus salilacus TaxID=2953750 RepID=UPI00209F665B|nr:Lrp/AsnC family transcriptional regulator [Halorussus salilacus]USZ67872.1 Lrp/AsnC family transcriptional regulator [Halorussus salilacus]
MSEDSIDHIDKGILYLLQENARNNTTSAIAEQVDVASSTVGNRIKRLEDRGVITGYHPSVDYQTAGMSHHVVVVGTVPFDDQRRVADAATEVDGVVRVRELLAGEGNVTVEVIGRSQTEIEERIGALTDLGLDPERVEMVTRETAQPFNHFGEQFVSDG